MAMDPQQVEELQRAVRAQNAMQHLQQMNLGQSMQGGPVDQSQLQGQEQVGQPPMMDQLSGVHPALTQGQSPQVGQMIEQVSLQLLQKIMVLNQDQTLNKEIQAKAVLTTAQAVAALMTATAQQTDISPQDKLQLEQQKMAHEQGLAEQKLSMEAQTNQQKMEMEQQKHHMDMARAQEQHDLQLQQAQAQQEREQQNHELQGHITLDKHEYEKQMGAAKLQLAAKQAEKSAAAKPTGGK